VKINQRGPFDFMVDTGSQITIVTPSLASELGLNPQGSIGLVSVSSYAQASVTIPDKLEAGYHVVDQPFVAIQSLGQIQAADPRIRGVLGENFLSHFDLFIDYAHKLLCLDETKAMQEKVHGERIPLVTPQHPDSELPFMEPLLISVHLSGAGTRQILLQLDSGSDGPILYARIKKQVLPILGHATVQGGNVSRAQQALAVLPPQDMRIGNRTLRYISFVTPLDVGRNVPTIEADGVLPTVLFQGVYISFADHYVVLDPR
jgi:hypothetical protein